MGAGPSGLYVHVFDVCGRNQFTEDNCSFPRGEEEAMKD